VQKPTQREDQVITGLFKVLKATAMLWDFLITVKCSFQRKEVAIAMRKIAKKQRNLGIVEGWVSVVLNTLLFGLKIWAGTLIGSVAMVADAWHTLSDTLTSLVVIIGFWIAGKPADRNTRLGMDARKILRLSSLEYYLQLLELISSRSLFSASYIIRQCNFLFGESSSFPSLSWQRKD